MKTSPAEIDKENTLLEMRLTAAAGKKVLNVRPKNNWRKNAKNHNDGGFRGRDRCGAGLLAGQLQLAFCSLHLCETTAPWHW